MQISKLSHLDCTNCIQAIEGIHELAYILNLTLEAAVKLQW